MCAKQCMCNNLKWKEMHIYKSVHKIKIVCRVDNCTCDVFNNIRVRECVSSCVYIYMCFKQGQNYFIYTSNIDGIIKKMLTN